MELSALTLYAKNMYGIPEQRKWAHFPGFSVLVHPETGRWLALLMRVHDPRTGAAVERCDIRCGPHAAERYADKPYIRAPYRMAGPNWVSADFREDTEPETVFDLFDEAVAFESPGGSSLIVLPPSDQADGGRYADTPLPIRRPERTGAGEEEAKKDAVPKRILQMQALYSYARFSAVDHDAWNFRRQGRYMEDYQDDCPWDGSVAMYFPTYRDLTVSQLRGYFTWRTHVRKGEYPQSPDAFAYMYIYELLNGIGAVSPQDTLNKLKEFAAGYLNSADEETETTYPSPGERMRRYLRTWCFDYALIHDLPKAEILEYADPHALARDTALEILKKVKGHSDDEIFSALSLLAGHGLTRSAYIKRAGAEGKRLFAGLWRYMAAHYSRSGHRIFSDCFGRLTKFLWRPLENAVYYREAQPQSTEFHLNAVRSYYRQNGRWFMKCYPQAVRGKLRELIHEADRLFRLDQGIGTPLRPNPKAAWATGYVRDFLEEERRAVIEAASPKIDFSQLDQIRKDAGQTRDSLLTDEERTGPDLAELFPPPPQARIPEPVKPAQAEPSDGLLLDDLHRHVLQLLMEGRNPEGFIRENHLMDSIVMDTINEAFFGEIGDNVLEYDGNTLSVVDDYKAEVTQALGGVVA